MCFFSTQMKHRTVRLSSVLESLSLRAIFLKRNTVLRCSFVRMEADIEVLYLQAKDSQPRQKLGKKHETDPLSQPPRNQPRWHLDFRFPASRTMRGSTSVVLSHMLFVFFIFPLDPLRTHLRVMSTMELLSIFSNILL